MNARAQTSAPILPRSAEEGHGGYGAASPAPFDGFNDSGFGIPTTRDVLEAPDAGGRAAGRGVLGALARTLTSGPVVKSAGVLSIFALGAAVGTLSARDADVGWVAKVRAFGSARARVSLAIVSRASFEPGFKARAATRASPLGSPPDARRDLDLRWRFTVATPRASSRKRRFSRHVERSRRVLARL